MSYAKRQALIINRLAATVRHTVKTLAAGLAPDDQITAVIALDEFAQLVIMETLAEINATAGTPGPSPSDN